MKRISTERFLESEWGENVTAIRINKKEEICFLGWFEDAESYNLVIANKAIVLHRGACMLTTMENAVTTSDGWAKPMSATMLMEEDRREAILGYIHPYTRNGVSDEGDYEILQMTLEEWQNLCDSLRTGDYIIIIED